MDRDGDFIAFAVDSNAVIMVVILLSRRELNVDLLLCSRRDHALFLVLDLEQTGHRGQNMKALRGR
jgi:hypothetical protein